MPKQSAIVSDKDSTMIRIIIKCLVLLALFVAATSVARATTFNVGANRQDKTLNAVLPRLKPGDVVQIDAGVYRETARLTMNGTREKPIVIRGVKGSRPVFDAQGLDTSGRGPIPRGAWQIEGAYLRIEHLEFKNARNGENAAGIRLLDSTNVTIRDCVISECDMGIFGGDRQTATIEDCDVGFNSTEKFNGYSHNFYMHGNRVVLRRCYIHDCLFGQNFKSRAHYNELWFNWIANSNEGEVGFVDAKGATDKPDSNALMVGNVLMSKAERTGNTAKFVLFGSESGASHNGTLYLFHNTFIAGNAKIHFITLSDARARLVAANNLFAGSTQIVAAPAPASVVAAHNVLPAGALLPNGWRWEPAGALQYADGDGTTRTLKPEFSDTTVLSGNPGRKLP